jgi:TolA-binding protein
MIYEAIDVRCQTERLGHDDCALATVRLAELHESAERWTEARAAWLRAADRATQSRTAARALARAAEVAHARLAQDDGPDGAETLAWRCVERYPDEIASDDALKLGIRVAEARDWQALEAKLAALQPRVVKFDVGDNVLYERALLLVRRERTAEAIGLFDQLAQAYPRSSLRDDGLWRAAGILRQQGDYQGALARLQGILSTKRKALIVGSYNYLQLDDAQLLTGRIWLDDLHDPVRAAKAFERLADEFPDSVLRDDALFDLARARQQQHDTAAACLALGRLLQQFPDGNRVRPARALRVELNCS